MLRLFILLVAVKLGFVAFVENESLKFIPDAVIFMVTVIGLYINMISPRGSFKEVVYPVLGILGLLASGSLTIVLNDNYFASSYTSLLRTVSPLLVFILLLQSNFIHEKKINPIEYRAVLALVFWIIFLVLYGILYLTPDSNRGLIWWGTVFGGLHESAYTLLAAAFLSYVIFSARPSIKNLLLLILISIFTMITLIFGWGVRTVGFAYILFIVVVASRPFGIKPIVSLSVIITTGIITILSLFAFDFISSENFMIFTSGRTAMYAEKVTFLLENTKIEWALGNGFGSDLMHSNVWWWATKGSHNDYLTFITENGIVFLLLLMSVLFSLFRRIGKSNGKIIFLLALMTSMVSNGYLVRPTAAYVLVIALSLQSGYNNEKRSYGK